MLIDTYIFVHDQNIILDNEKNKKYNNLTNYTYVFLGDKDTSLLKDNSKVIIAKNLEYNLENYPKLTAFTGWYALYKNNIIKPNNEILLLEYDIDIVDNFEDVIIKSPNLSSKIIGFIGANPRGYDFINNPKYINSISNAIKKIYDIDIVGFTKEIIKTKNIKWMCSNNVLFKYDTFISYMEWFEPLINEIKEDVYSGHNQERCTTLYALFNDIEFNIEKGILKHYFLDSQKTYKKQSK